MQVSARAYYAWIKQPEPQENPRKMKNLKLKSGKFSMTLNRLRVPVVVGELHKAGFKAGRYEVRTLMRKLVLKPHYPNPDKPDPRWQSIFGQKEILGCTGKFGRSADSRPPECSCFGRFNKITFVGSSLYGIVIFT